MFAARIRGLPPAAFQLLLLAVLSGTGDLRLLQDAGDGDRVIKDLAPAERARLVRIDSAAGAARSRLWLMAARASQAPFAGNQPEGR